MTTFVIRVTRPPISMLFPLRAIVVLAALATVVLGLMMLGLLVGTQTTLSPIELLSALFGPADTDPAFVVRELRLPRVLAGAVVGFAMGISGCIFQSVARNGLVSPDIIGVTSGASLGALVVIVLGTRVRGAGDAFEVPLSYIGPAAVVGAFGASLVVYVLGYRHGLSPYRLVLVGIGVTSVLGAGIAYALTLTRFPFATQLAFRWTVGSMYGVDWTEVMPALVVFAVLVVVAVLVSRPLTALGLGDDTATGLGAHVERDRLLLIAIAVCFAALAVAVAGPVAFVAFVAPHIAHALLLLKGLALVFASGAIGAALTLFADFVAQRVLDGTELPLGAVTALIGAPYFLALLYRTNRIGGGG